MEEIIRNRRPHTNCENTLSTTHETNSRTNYQLNNIITKNGRTSKQNITRYAPHGSQFSEITHQNSSH